jgi:hypothetical protein
VSGELFDRSLRSLYRSSDDVSGLGAAVKYLSHRASRNVGSDCLIPQHSGTAHLVCSCLWVDVWVPQVRWTDRDSDQWLNSIIRRRRAPPKQELTALSALKRTLNPRLKLPNPGHILMTHRDEGWRPHQPAKLRQGGFHISGMWPFQRQM